MEVYQRYFPIPTKKMYERGMRDFIPHNSRFNICVDPVTRLWECDKPPKTQSTQLFHPMQTRNATIPSGGSFRPPPAKPPSSGYNGSKIDLNYVPNEGQSSLTKPLINNIMKTLNPPDAQTTIPDAVKVDAHKIQAAKLYKRSGIIAANDYLADNNVNYEIMGDDTLNKPGVVLESKSQNANGEFDYEIAYPETDITNMNDVREAVRTIFNDSYDSSPPYMDNASQQIDTLTREKQAMPSKLLGASKGGAISHDMGSVKGIDTVTFNPLVTDRFVRDTFRNSIRPGTQLGSPDYIMGSPNRRMRWGTRLPTHTIHRTTDDFASIGLAAKHNNLYGDNVMGDRGETNVNINNYTPVRKGLDPFESHYLKEQFIDRTKTINETEPIEQYEHPLVKYNRVKDTPGLLESAKSMIEFGAKRKQKPSYSEWALKHEPADVMRRLGDETLTQQELTSRTTNLEALQTQNNALNNISAIDKDLYDTQRIEYKDQLNVLRNAQTIYGPRHKQSKLPALWKKLGYNFTDVELVSGAEFADNAQFDDINNLEISDDFMINAQHREAEIGKAQTEVETVLDRLHRHHEPAHEIAEQFNEASRDSVSERMISTSGRVAPIAAGAMVAAPAFAELGYQIKGEKTPDALRIANKLLFAVMGGLNPLTSTFVNSEISQGSDDAYANNKSLKEAYRLEEFAGRKGVNLQTDSDGSATGTDPTTGQTVKYVEYP